MDNEERMKKLLQAVYKPVSASSEFKERLLKSLTDQISSRTFGSPISFWQRRRLWVTVAVVVVLAITGVAIWLSRPETPTTVISPEVSPEEPLVTPEESVPPEESPVLPEEPVQMANFRLLISDEVNAIEHFESLEITISSIGLLPAGETEEDTEGWITPGIAPRTVDLRKLIGDNATELWTGYVEPGSYTKVFIYVTENITYSLESGGEADIKLPSNKLQVPSLFEVSKDGSDSIVSFVFDVTVVEAGMSGQYIIKPQIAQSGPDKPFNLVTPEVKPVELGNPARELGLNVTGNVVPGGIATIVVTDNGSNVEGARVTVTFDGKKILEGKTDSNGSLVITLPASVGILNVEAAFREKRGELEIAVQI